VLTIQDTGLVPRRWNGAARCFLSLWVCCLLTVVAWGQEPEHALKPPDRSSPRAALKTFLESGDAIGAFLVREYFPSPSRAAYDHLRSQVKTFIQGLDLSEVSPASNPNGLFCTGIKPTVSEQ
jgi:hypothetical protein